MVVETPRAMHLVQSRTTKLDKAREQILSDIQTPSLARCGRR